MVAITRNKDRVGIGVVVFRMIESAVVFPLLIEASDWREGVHPNSGIKNLQDQKASGSDMNIRAPSDPLIVYHPQ